MSISLDMGSLKVDLLHTQAENYKFQRKADETWKLFRGWDFLSFGQKWAISEFFFITILGVISTVIGDSPLLKCRLQNIEFKLVVFFLLSTKISAFDQYFYCLLLIWLVVQQIFPTSRYTQDLCVRNIMFCQQAFLLQTRSLFLYFHPILQPFFTPKMLAFLQ